MQQLFSREFCFEIFYRVDVKLLSDVDECRVNNGGCSMNCMNTVGSFDCKCHRGYALRPDGRTCEGMKLCSLCKAINGFSLVCVGTCVFD